MGRGRRRDETEKLLHTNRRSQGAGYRMQKQRPETRVALALSPLGFDAGGRMLGRVQAHMGDRISILWDDANEAETWRSEDCRYKVDRGLMIFTAPPKPRRIRIAKDKLVCKQCGELRKGCDCPRVGAAKPEERVNRNHPDQLVGSSNLSLTGEEPEDSMYMKPRGHTPRTEERQTMTETKTFSAKEVARELGTDARTLRKFLRSDASPVEPPGQGGRYEFTSKQVKKVKRAFDAWGTKKTTTKTTKSLPLKDAEEVLNTDDPADLEDLDGPNDEDLIDLDDIDLEDL
jgi:hypothetical protein